MNWIDIVFVIMLVFGGILGAVSGAFWQATRTAIVIVSLYVTVYYHWLIGNWLADRISDPNQVLIIAYTATFCIIASTLLIITWVIEYFAHKAEITPAERIGGTMLGMFQAAIVCGAIMLGLIYYPNPGIRNDIKNSALSPYVLTGMRMLTLAIPSDYKQCLRDFIEEEPPAANPVPGQPDPSQQAEQSEPEKQSM